MTLTKLSGNPLKTSSSNVRSTGNIIVLLYGFISLFTHALYVLYLGGVAVRDREKALPIRDALEARIFREGAES